MKPAYMQMVGMVGLAQSVRRTFTWALRLMFLKIERLSVPPQTAVPIRAVRGDEPATHAPIQVAIHAARGDANSGKGVPLSVLPGA
jgi:hypothetical protein